MIHRHALTTSLLLTAVSAAPALAQTPPSSDVVGSATEALLGSPFTSRVDGIAFRPPAGGTQIRQLDSGEIVRFAYPDLGWTVRLTSAPNAARIPLTGDAAQPGLLDLSSRQLTDRGGQPATLLRKDVVPLGSRQIGLIEARDNAGINRLFTQIALVPDGRLRYFVLQMVSPGQDNTVPALAGDGGLAQEAQARQMFQRMLATVSVLDRSALRREQEERLLNTRGLWVQLDQRRIESTLRPVHYMRIVRDGRDVGYVQVNERPEAHHGQDGVAVIVREHADAPPAAAAAPVSAAPADSPAVDLPRPAVPGLVATPSQVDRDARFFITFDRGHEEWTTVIRLDDKPGADLIEMGNSDVELHRVLDASQQRNQVRGGRAGDQPPVIDRQVDTLQVDDYRGRVRTGPSIQQPLPPYYLPQATAQLLPRLLPLDVPKQYLFAFYVSDVRRVLMRYVDVGVEREAELDGHQVRAVPITDRVGADGASTVHYMAREDGQWLGSVSDDGKLQVLPTDEATLRTVWKGFAPLPEPPPAAEDDLERHPTRPPRRGAPRPRPPGVLPPTLDSAPLNGR